ncbi:MAG: hypothetical protein MHMPM18_000389 [Marteilia pararefringens]
METKNLDYEVGDLFSENGLGYFENSGKMRKIMQEEEEEAAEVLNGVKSIEKYECEKKLDDLVKKCNAYTHYLREKIKKSELANNKDDDESIYHINGKLFDFQKKGVNWLLQLYEVGVNGILGDEMGLGKTVQVIAMISYLCSVGIHKNFLIIGPLSTLNNWRNEFKKFAPHISVMIYSSTTRVKSQADMQNIMDTNQVIVTSYDYPILDRKLFKNTVFKLMIVDEGHRLKNNNSSLFYHLHSFKTAHKVLLTGTPIMNDAVELWSLLNFLMPEIFNDLSSFKSWFSAKILHRQTVRDAIIKSEENENILKKLHDIIEPFMLRRLKKNFSKIFSLPPKKEILIYTPVTQFQKYLADKLQSMDKKSLQDGTIEPFSRFQRSKERHIEKLADVVWKFKLIRGQMEYRHIVNHPLMYVWPENQDDVDLTYCLSKLSGKMIYFEMLITQLLAKGHKILVFSQFVMMLNILRDFMDTIGIKFSSFDGNHTIDERQEEIDKFNNDKTVKVFILSTRSGGLGLNLTAADTVIFYDSDWNPCMDLQAQDRCHRFGQTKPIAVYRLISKNTYDERMFNATIGKYRLSRAILMESDKGNASLLSDRTNLNEDMRIKDLNNIMSAKIGDLSFVEDEKRIKKFDKEFIDRDILFRGMDNDQESTVECTID